MSSRDEEIRETLRQMLKDWNNFTPEERAKMLANAAAKADSGEGSAKRRSKWFGKD